MTVKSVSIGIRHTIHLELKRLDLGLVHEWIMFELHAFTEEKCVEK